MSWETLKEVLEVHSTQREKIEMEYPTETERKGAAIHFWFWNHPYASWRLLITRLNWMYEHTLASRLYRYAERVTGRLCFHSDNVNVP